MQNSFQQLKKNSWNLRQESYKKRLEYLEQLAEVIKKYETEIVQALHEDFKKPENETILTEIYPVLQEIRYAQKNLKSWCAPVPVSSPLSFLTTSCEVRYEAKGVCLIIAPWNYPFQLAIAPLIAAIAAGNAVILKPSELTPRTSALIRKMLLEIFSTDHVLVIEGGVEISEQILKLPFDHIFFTGSTAVGKIVMAAASRTLASVTLELGGKSPTIVDESANIAFAAAKVAWGKFLNAGQTCVAPDFIFVQESVREEFTAELKKQLLKFYGETPQNSPDLARIVSTRHWQRLDGLLQDSVNQGAKVEIGGQSAPTENYLAPTVLSSVPLSAKIMHEEIFGPILPMISFTELHEVIEFIQERPKPLALYIFSNESKNIEKILSSTSAGGVCINDTVIHLGNHDLPFGGTGESGSGNYHGFFGFKAFSHEKAILRQSRLGFFLKILYPPYSPIKKSFIKFLMKWGL